MFISTLHRVSQLSYNALVRYSEYVMTIYFTSFFYLLQSYYSLLLLGKLLGKKCFFDRQSLIYCKFNLEVTLIWFIAIISRH